jgi:hypothetical protein
MADDAESDDHEWKYSVEEVGPDAGAENGDTDSVEITGGEVPDELVADADDHEDDGGSVAGSLTSTGPIEPEIPSLENTIFVFVGVYIGLIALLSMTQPAFLGSPVNLLLLTGGVVAVAVLSFGIFGLLGRV